MKKKVIIAISGGVDSSVSALLLLQQGYSVEAIFMKNWIEEEQFCSFNKDLKYVKIICKKLKIKLHVIEFADEYWNNVFCKSIILFNKGYTPNPDILCNKEIKFNVLLKYILSIKMSYLATGHYIEKIKINKIYYLLKNKDIKKDQSYFLHMVSQIALKKSIFPIGHLYKIIVRKIASYCNFANALKKDSTGICFIGKKKFNFFIKNYIIEKKGLLLNEKKNIISKHDGVMFYTIGQKYILNSIKLNSFKPFYVYKKNIIKNFVFICEGNVNLNLFKKELTVNKINWMSKLYHKNGICMSKIRHQGYINNCIIVLHKKNILIRFKIKQRAIASKQSIVFYKNKVCLGGSYIN